MEKRLDAWHSPTWAVRRVLERLCTWWQLYQVTVAPLVGSLRGNLDSVPPSRSPWAQTSGTPPSTPQPIPPPHPARLWTRSRSAPTERCWQASLQDRDQGAAYDHGQQSPPGVWGQQRSPSPPSQYKPRRTETNATRRERSSLAQLRSGYCKLLNSYLFRINGTPDVCPLCLETPHNTHHLFDCRENPTTLTVLDLWTRPAEVANFLKLDEPD